MLIVKYTPEHEWLEYNGEVVTVGITEHAAEQLGDVVFVELPEEDTPVTKGDEVVVIESVKAAADILAPMDGVITEVNPLLEDEPELVSKDPLGQGWFFRMKPNDPADLDQYMDEAEYKAHIAGG